MLLLFALHGSSQTSIAIPHFEHFPTNNIWVYASYRDADGILWLGTSHGLLTYAQLQSSFQLQYRYNEQLNNVITEIHQDNTGRLWLKTQALRYIVYNPRTNECISDVENYFARLGAKFSYQFYVYVDTQGRIYAFKGSHIFFKDFKTGRSAYLTMPAFAGPVIKMTDDGRRLVIVSRNAIYTMPLSLDEKPRPTFITSTPDPTTKEDTKVAIGNDGTLWLASNMRLRSFAPSERRWRVHSEVRPDINGMLTIPDGRVFVSTTNNGLFIFSPKGELIQNILQTAPLVDGLQNSHLESIYFDYTSNSLIISYHKKGLSLWADQSQAGIQQFHIQSAAHDYIVEDVITFASADNNILIGTEDDGVYILNADGTIIGNKYPGYAATAIATDSKNHIWTGLYHGGLACDDGRRFFPDRSPYKIVEAGQDSLIIILNGDGIWAVNAKTGDAKLVPTDNRWVMDLVECRGRLYTSTPNYLYVIDPKTLRTDTISASRFTNSGFGNGTKDLAADRRGWIWIANYKGNSPVDIYDTHNGHIMQVRELSNYIIKGIAEDADGNMWCTTDKGLVRVAVSNGPQPAFTLTLFDDNHLYNDRALYRLSDGRMAAGFTDGYEIFRPDVLIKGGNGNATACPLILATLYINGNAVSPSDTIAGHVLLTTDLPYVRSLDLEYNENNITLEYLPKDLGKESGKTWAYSISKVTDGFIPMAAGRITLGHLSPGTYNVALRVGTANSVSAHEYTVLTIHVARPWWLSWWFIAICLLVIATIVLLIYHNIHNRILYHRRLQELREAIESGKTISTVLPEVRPSDITVTTLDEDFLSQAKDIIEHNIADSGFTVDNLASKLGMHRTNLYRKITDVTGKTPLLFIRSMKMQRAHQLMSRGGVRVSDVAFKVGYNSPKLFTKHFKDEYGITPSDFLKLSEEAARRAK